MSSIQKIKAGMLRISVLEMALLFVGVTLVAFAFAFALAAGGGWTYGRAVGTTALGTLIATAGFAAARARD